MTAAYSNSRVLEAVAIYQGSRQKEMQRDSPPSVPTRRLFLDLPKQRVATRCSQLQDGILSWEVPEVNRLCVRY